MSDCAKAISNKCSTNNRRKTKTKKENMVHFVSFFIRIAFFRLLQSALANRGTTRGRKKRDKSWKSCKVTPAKILFGAYRCRGSVFWYLDLRIDYHLPVLVSLLLAIIIVWAYSLPLPLSVTPPYIFRHCYRSLRFLKGVQLVVPKVPHLYRSGKKVGLENLMLNPYLHPMPQNAKDQLISFAENTSQKSCLEFWEAKEKPMS